MIAKVVYGICRTARQLRNNMGNTSIKEATSQEMPTRTSIRKITVDYDAKAMRTVPYEKFCQCKDETHKQVFTEVENDNGSHHIYCNVGCYHFMIAVARSCQYKNCLRGMVLYRGSGAGYTTEIPTLLRHPPEIRKKCLTNLLRMAKHLPRFNQDNNLLEGARMFDSRNPILTTIRILALVQHYSDVINDTLKRNDDDPEKYIATPMLDTTRDPRVAASFATLAKKQGVVRLLLLPAPRSVLCTSNVDLWGHDDSVYGSFVQRLGDTKMLLVFLTTILPPCALRPLNQFGCLFVHEDHLDAFHTLRLALCSDTNITVDQVLEQYSDKADIILTDRHRWDALKSYNVLDVRLPPKVPSKEFFHALPEEVGNAFPVLEQSQLFPIMDPMKAYMQSAANYIKENQDLN